MRMLLFLLALVLPLPAQAVVGPDEIMEDPVLQSRAMDLYSDLRCVKCRSENIESSNADWANDARAVVRERLLAGDSDQEVLAFFQDRYGDYVLMNPPFAINNALLWLAGPLLLVIGSGIAFAFLRSRAKLPPPVDDLSEAERRRLKELTED